MILVGAMLAQVILALTMQELALLGLVHAVGIFVVGCYAVLKQNLALLICLLAYLTGSEVLWRQVRAPVFHLMAPYMFILLSAFAVLFVLRRLNRDGRLALLYAVLMLPATVATVRTAGEGARELISFALSGPLALAAFVMFTSQMKVQPWLYRRILWVTLVSTLGPLTVALWNIRSELAARGSIEFRGQSNFVTSGGFGPVQVSSVLSLGIMAAILLIISERDRIARTIAAVLAVILTVQTLLTFSRGGSFAVGIAVTALAVAQARNRQVRNRILAVASVALLLAYLLVFPWLESFTDGEFETRFSDTESSRTDLATNDTQIFTDNILFGVGPGMTKYQRLTYEICQIRTDQCRQEASSHTEFTRMLGEHGIPGLVSMALLATLALSAVRRAGPGRAFAVAWVAWTIAQMFYANLRIVAVPFAFGLAFLHLAGPARANPPPEEEDELTPQPAPGTTKLRRATVPGDVRLNGSSINGSSHNGRPHSNGLNGSVVNGSIVPDAIIPPPLRPPPYRPRPGDGPRHTGQIEPE